MVGMSEETIINKLFYNTDTFYTIWFEFKQGKDYAGKNRVFWIEFKVYKISAIGDDGTLYYGINGDDAEELNPEYWYAKGHIKWDGCMEIDLSNHFCGWSKEFGELFKDIYLQAAEIMGEENEHDIEGLDELKMHYGL